MHKTTNQDGPVDPESRVFLAKMAERNQARANHLGQIRSVLVVLSSRSMAFDIESLKQKIGLAYPEAKTFFVSTQGKPVGMAGPDQVDLLIDFTGPGQSQGWFYSKKLRKRARFAVGRNAGLFRKKDYNRIFDEKKNVDLLPGELLDRERIVQKEVLKLAGVPVAPMGDLHEDLGKSIALDLPPLQALSKKV